MIQQKVVDEISLNFTELFLIGKYVKLRFKNGGWPCYFWSLRGQKIKNITKTEQKRWYLFTFFGFIFYGVSRAKIDLHNKYMILLWFYPIFWTKWSIELNYFRSLLEKMASMCTYFKTRTDFLFLFWLSEDLTRVNLCKDGNFVSRIYWKSGSSNQ